MHLSKQKLPNLNDVINFTESEILKIINQKQAEAANDVFIAEKTRGLKGLNDKLLNKPLEIKGIWKPDLLKIQASFKNYLQSTFSIANIHQIANKHDVEAIINGVCQNYGLSFSIDPDFTDLLQLIVSEKTNWFSEWDNIIGIL